MAAESCKGHAKEGTDRRERSTNRTRRDGKREKRENGERTE